MSEDANDDFGSLEDTFFGAAKRLLTAWSLRTAGYTDSDIQRIIERHGLEAPVIEKLYETLCPGTGLRFSTSIAGFESYAEKQRKRPEISGDALDLANNESPLGPSSRVTDVLRDNLDRIGLYPPLSDLHLRQHLAEFLRTPEIGETHLVLGRGVNHLISEIAFAFLTKGDRVTICDRSFPVYWEMAERSACRVTTVPVRADHTYDVEALCRSFEEGPRLVFLGSPNNPTGTLLEQEDFARVLEHLPAGSLLVLDECYRDFAEVDAPLPATFEAIAAGRDVISLRSFSKAHGLAGLRAGYAVARPEVASYLEKRREPYHASQLVILACLTALDDPGHVHATVELIRRERSRLAAGLEALGLETWPSHGNFLLFHGRPIGATGNAIQMAKEITHCLESSHGIRIRNLGGGFNVPGHLRVTVGRTEDNARFLWAMKQVLFELGLRSET